MKTKFIQLFIVTLFCGIVPITANATLGESTSSIMSDQLALSATPTQAIQSSNVEQVFSTNNYQTNSITTPSGIVIKQFSYNNKVFAVVWNGKKVPDQSQLFGKYFSTFQNSTPSYQSLNIRKVTTDDFISSTGGWMGHYSGKAFIPSLAPAGLTINSLN